MAEQLPAASTQQNTRAVARIGTMEVMPLENIKSSMALVQSIVKEVMVKDTHYGTIPGTKKPTMYKAGAQLVATAFRCRPEYLDTVRDLDNGHREVVSICKLVHIASGEYMGEGGGSCSTMESKYRYRAVYEDTGKPVSRQYFDLVRANKHQEAAALMPGKGHSAKKNEEGKWTWHKAAGLQENPDVADVWNTVLKMAHKRAEVDAVISTFGLGGIFVQDMEDLPEYLKDGAIEAEFTATSSPDSPTFDDTFKDYDQAKVQAFLDLCSKSENVSIEEVKASAMGDIDGFKKALADWIQKTDKPKSTRGKKTEAPAQPDGPEPPAAGNGKAQKITEDQAQEINKTMSEFQLSFAAFKRRFSIDNIADLPADQFDEAKTWMNLEIDRQ